MENYSQLGEPLVGPVTSDSIEAALATDWRELLSAAGPDHPVARPSVLTLIVAVLDPARTNQVLQTIEHLSRQHPSRTIALLPSFAQSAAELQVWHSPVCMSNPADGRLICGDQIVIAARGDAVHHLPSLADQLALTDLPTFLWWTDDFAPADDELFDRLTDIADRVIVDSGNFRSLGPSIERLARLADRQRNPCIPSDLNWARLTPWRDLLAQLFDSPALRPSLDRVTGVELTYDPTDSCGPAQTLLLLAWLADRLGWKLAPSRRAALPGAPGQTLPSSLQGLGGEVVATIRSGAGVGGICGLSRAALVADDAGTFSVTRAEDGVHAVAEANVPGGLGIRHSVRFETPSESDLLADEMLLYGRDYVYEETLHLAADLVETPEAGGPNPDGRRPNSARDTATGQTQKAG